VLGAVCGGDPVGRSSLFVLFVGGVLSWLCCLVAWVLLLRGRAAALLLIGGVVRGQGGGCGRGRGHRRLAGGVMLVGWARDEMEWKGGDSLVVCSS
jgi:hypothetical protein